MKKTLLLAACMLLGATGMRAQLTTDGFKAKVERQMSATGISGPGVELLIDRWEEAFPEDPDMLNSRFAFLFDKSKSECTYKSTQSKYMGREPVLTLKEDGTDVNFFEDTAFDNGLFAEAMQVADRAIGLYPDELVFRFNKINALIAYEKENPDLATEELTGLIAEDIGHRPAWTWHRLPIDRDTFTESIQEYCYTLFSIGSPAAYSSFRSISEQMLARDRKSVSFLDNLGSYWLVAENNIRKAEKYYRKALKIDPEDYPATANLKIIEARKKNPKKK